MPPKFVKNSLQVHSQFQSDQVIPSSSVQYSDPRLPQEAQCMFVFLACFAFLVEVLLETLKGLESDPTHGRVRDPATGEENGPEPSVFAAETPGRVPSPRKTIDLILLPAAAVRVALE